MEGSIMKRRFTAIFILTVLIVFMSQAAVTADETWKIGGDWGYRISGQGTYLGSPATMTENGVVRINVTTSNEKEILNNYSITSTGNITIPSLNYSHDYHYTDTDALPQVEYIPGAPVEFSYNQTIDGEPVLMTIRFIQTGAYSASGTVTLYVVRTGETNVTSLTASKPQPEPDTSGGDSGGGGCNAGLSALLLLAIVPVLFKRRH